MNIVSWITIMVANLQQLFLLLLAGLLLFVPVLGNQYPQEYFNKIENQI